jgi:hypothetical protein
LNGGCELAAKVELARLEDRWMDIRESGDPEDLIVFAAEFSLAGQSFMILRDLSELAMLLNGGVPGSGEALSRLILERGEALRRMVLGKLKALDRELPWGFLDNRPMLTLLAYYVDEFAATRPTEVLDLLRWSVNVANPTDNTGLRETLIHRLVATGQADEAVGVAERYPDDFASTEYGRVLALFAAGRQDDAAAALQKAVAASPKVWKTLHASNPKAPKSSPYSITVGGADEAYLYRKKHLDLWRSSGALRWGAGIKLAKPKAASDKPAPEGDHQQSLPGFTG